ncbi:zf-TFIIB domain-containing protein [Solidesulfovibrio sp.]|uniref:TFIIB-type zinc ribbon-containing protein n=1 Tax=Solidesulfovibrio sp. TaxID=2910990 RepID=UPI00260E30AA|nr:zf-TFIIB domain-containing protein [Solidesulfovibrio sp.]
MQCPKCAIPLHMAERCGIEIDYCQQCRGVWLDRGELDKIVERSTLPQQQTERAGHVPYQAQADRSMPTSRHLGSHGGYGYNKKKSFLGELFDFD